MKTMALSVVLALGCGAAVDDLEELELEQTEQAFVGKVTPSFQFGTNTSAQRLRCNRTTSGQVCVVPKAKSLSYCIDRHFSNPQDPIFSESEATRIRNLVQGLGASGWSFSEISPFNCTDGTMGIPDIVFFVGSVGSSGTGSNDVKDYATNIWSCASGSPGCLNNLTEGTGVTGQYQSWTHCKVVVDRTDIYAKGTTATQDNQGFDHASKHGFLGCLGIGGRSISGGFASRTLFQPSSSATSVTTGENCSLVGFTTASAGQYNHALAPCTSE